MFLAEQYLEVRGGGCCGKNTSRWSSTGGERGKEGNTCLDSEYPARGGRLQHAVLGPGLGGSVQALLALMLAVLLLEGMCLASAFSFVL